MNFLTALNFAKKLELRLPDQINIIAIEIVEDLTFSNDFSPEITRKLDQVCSNVKDMLMELLKD